MSNQKVDEDVHWAVWRAVRWAVDRVVDDDVWGAAEDAVGDAVNWAVDEAVGDAVYWVVSRAVQQDPAYPAFQDFLEEARL